jgi:hypothetical protein
VSTHTPSGTRRGKEDDNVAQKLDVVLQYLLLLSGKLRVGRIEFQPMWEISERTPKMKIAATFYTA